MAVASPLVNLGLGGRVSIAAVGSSLARLALPTLTESRRVTRSLRQPNQGRVMDARTILVLMRGDEVSHGHDLVATFLRALRDEIGEASVQFGFLPESNSLPYARQLLAPMIDAKQIAGVIAVSCPRDVYSYLAGLGIPVVVNGSLYAEDRSIPSLDVDNRAAGRLLAEYLLERKHKRIALLCHHSDQPGQHDFHDGVCEAMSEKGLPATSLLVRRYPGDLHALRGLIFSLMRSEEAPTAIILRGGELVAAVTNVLNEVCAGKGLPKIVCDGYPTDSRVCAHVAPRLTTKQVAALLCQMLGKLTRGIELSEKRVVVPVELRRTVPAARFDEWENDK